MSSTIDRRGFLQLLGTGVGTFQIAYARYAETAFTLHAHNSYLQWMGETGIPGMLFLLTGLAAVNVTLGLPIVRTSVAHGTAYDIAGKGIASAQSLLEAARVAARLACSQQSIA